MRIAVDAQSTEGRRTGIGQAAEVLLTAMAKAAPDIEWLLLKKGGSGDLNTPQRILWESCQIPSRAKRLKADLIYSPGFAPPMRASVPRIVTVHDLIGMTYRGNQGSISSFYWSKWLPAAVKRAHHLAASSEATRKDIERLLGIPSDRISVVPCAAHPRYRVLDDAAAVNTIVKKYGLDRPYLISVCTSEPRKNLDRLVRAYGRLSRTTREKACLAVIGKQGPAGDSVRAAVDVAGLRNDVRFLGYVPDEDLVSLYNGSIGYACVSLAEGFGLPALEAMRCGKSGVASNTSSLPEVVGDTAVSVDPQDEAAIGSALERWITDGSLRAQLSARARERSLLFSPERSAQSMINIFREQVKK